MKDFDNRLENLFSQRRMQTENSEMPLGHQERFLEKLEGRNPGLWHRIAAWFNDQSAGKKADDFAKAKAAYDYLIEHCAYDYDYSGNSLQETQTTASYADGALLDHKAVCSGYSRAFKLIMDYCGIECMCVSNSDHEWNVVKLEGNYYHIDVTWADTEQNTGERYFCVTDEEIYKDHEKPAFELPECVMVR